VNCSPYSGSQFRLGDTMVTCNATDKSGNRAQKSFTVTVQDTTPPTLTVPLSITVEASEPSTSVSYPPATATDTVDPLPRVECYPASPIIIAGTGSQTINCNATDKSGNTAQKSFTVTVQDTTPPKLTLPPNPLIVTPSNPAPPSPPISDAVFMQRAPRIPVNFTVSATDNIDGTSTLEEDGSTITQDNVGGNIMISCNPPSGSMFLVGNTTTVRCSARDATNNTGTASFTVSVNAPPPPPADTTAPVVEANVQGTLGNNGWYTSDVAVSWTVTDPESQITSKSESCDQTTTINQDTTAGGQTVTCTAASAGGTTTQSVTIKRDATAPDIAIDSGISDGDVFEKGQVPSEPACTATDGASGIDGQGCQVLGYSTEVGKHTITFTATDNAGNKATQEVSYSINDKPPQQELQPRQKLQPQQELQPRRGLQPQNESQVG
jgi:hypothetical protein